MERPFVNDNQPNPGSTALKYNIDMAALLFPLSDQGGTHIPEPGAKMIFFLANTLKDDSWRIADMG